MDKESYSLFVVTKPLQYFNATNIRDDNRRICLIVDLFNDARSLFVRLNEVDPDIWFKVLFFENVSHAYRWLIKNRDTIVNLYIDSDYGFSKYFYLHKLSKLNIYVYEEGMGTYRSFLRDKTLFNHFIGFIYNILGHENYLGGSKYTKGIFLYDINRHRNLIPECKKELRPFERSFTEHIALFSRKDLFLDKNINDVLKDAKGKKVILYLTSWVYHKDVDELLSGYPGYIKMLKPHPHLKIDFTNREAQYDHVIIGSIMVELFIYQLLKEVEELIVVNRNSSSLMYFEGYERLTSLQI